jgi:hypothetical protein
VLFPTKLLKFFNLVSKLLFSNIISIVLQTPVI